MIVTAIQEQKKTKNRFNIYIDGEYAFALGGVDVLYFKLSENAEISQQRLDEINQYCIFEKAKNDALRYVGFKARTRYELKTKLSEQYLPDITEKTVEFMEKYGYIDDKSFALDYAKEKSRINGWGGKKIAYELSNKGVSQADISNMLQSGIINENSKLSELISKKLRGKTDIDIKEKQKLFAFLARRGFGYDEIKSAFSEYIECGDELC